MNKLKNMPKQRPDERILFLCLIPILVGLDQLTKWWAGTYLAEHGPIPIIPGVFSLTYSINRGAAWGILQNKIPFFVLITLVMILVICMAYTRIPRDRHYIPLQLTLVLLLSGAIGNLIDRVWHQYVIDFLYFELIHFPIFNVADTYVTISACSLILLLLFFYKDETFSFWQRKKKEAKEPAGEERNEEERIE